MQKELDTMSMQVSGWQLLSLQVSILNLTQCGSLLEGTAE